MPDTPQAKNLPIVVRSSVPPPIRTCFKTVALAIDLVGWSATHSQQILQLGATFANDALLRIAGQGSLILTLGPDWQGLAAGSFSWSREDADTRRVLQANASTGVRRKLSSHANLNLQLFGNYLDNDQGISQQGGVRSALTVDDAVGKDTRLTLSPSYSAQVNQDRHSQGYSTPRTDHRVFLNLKLEFR